MALQTNVLRGGEWVTETVNLQSVLQGAAASPSTNSQARQPVGKPATYGVLTKTAIESAVAQFILPVRLRSSHHVDVAFVGDHYVQIRELGRDSQLRDVIRKTDFGTRIINARVIGGTPEDEDDSNENDVKIKVEDGTNHNGGMSGDIDMDDIHTAAAAPNGGPVQRRLPPQQLVIVLENGDQIFMFLETLQDGRLYFNTTQYKPPGKKIVPPGRHAAVDPSSRYLALACDEGLFTVSELNCQRELSRVYAAGGQLQYIKSYRPRPVYGIIHKMEFLYPGPDDDYQIILLLIIIERGIAKMVIYEWEAGEDLRGVLTEKKRGQNLPMSSEKPLLIVPLTFNSAFFTVSAGQIWFCPNSLHQPAKFESFSLEAQRDPSPHSRQLQLWSAWARPYRLPTYNAANDSIYLARQNGSVVYLELNSDNLITSHVEVGNLKSDIGAFCTVFDQFGDILIVGGHSGPGTMVNLPPRQATVHLGDIPNWASLADVVTTYEKVRAPGTHTTPDRMFGASVYGDAGAITEFRSGMRACAGLDFDVGDTIRRTWIFPVRSVDYDLTFHILVSFVDRTMSLLMSEDLNQVSNLDGGEDEEVDTAPIYDLSSRTVAAALFSEDVVIQVTEKNLVFAAVSGSVFHPHSALFGDNVTIVDACISGALVAISTHAQANESNIHLLRISLQGTISIVRSFVQSGEPTCLTLSSFGNVPAIVAGIVHEGSKPSIGIYSINENEPVGAAEVVPLFIDLSSSEIGQLLPPTSNKDQESRPIEPLSSIAMIPRQGRAAAIAFGTRAGQVGTIVLDEAGRAVSATVDTIGLATAHISILGDSVVGKSVLATCDGKLCLQSNLDWSVAKFRSTKSVWVVVDASENRLPSPPITSTTILPGNLPGREGRIPLVLSSGSRVMLAELESHSEPAHRKIPLKGKPQKLIYSHNLNCLVVAITEKDTKATLQFIDPDSGEDVSLAVDSHGAPIEYARGLGERGDRILGLAEWIIEREGNKWVQLLVSTLHGRFLVLSVKRSESRRSSSNDGSTPGPAKIKYWTRHKKPRASAPVYTTACEDNNVFSCVGSLIKWDKLDVAAKRLDSHGEYSLPSPASSLQIVNGKLVATTLGNSVQIIDYKGGNAAAGEMTLHHAESSDNAPARHMIDVSPEGAGSPPMLLVSLGNWQLSGVWVPWRMIGKSCNTVFEVDLPSEGLCKLVRGRTRPSWQQMRRNMRYGMLDSSEHPAEVLGAFEDGSMQHFTILKQSIWRVLRYIQNYADTSVVLYPYSYLDEAPINENGTSAEQHEAQVEARRAILEDLVPDSRTGMHIDGDMLQRCLDERALEQLFAEPQRAERLFTLLDELDGGRWTSKFASGEASTTPLEQKRRDYFGLMYDILEYYLEPVF